jgi:hypothetical protein
MSKLTVAVALLGATYASAITNNAYAWGDMGKRQATPDFGRLACDPR